MDILQTEVWRGGPLSDSEKISDSGDEIKTTEVSLTEEEEATFSLLRMARDQRGFFKVEIAPILNNIVFKIFFFILATSLVFLVSVLTAFVVMRLVEYFISLIQVEMNICTYVVQTYLPQFLTIKYSQQTPLKLFRVASFVPLRCTSGRPGLPPTPACSGETTKDCRHTPRSVISSLQGDQR